MLIFALADFNMDQITQNIVHSSIIRTILLLISFTGQITNTLAYYNTELFMIVHSVMVQSSASSPVKSFYA
jgi:hypothetical protein